MTASLPLVCPHCGTFVRSDWVDVCGKCNQLLVAPEPVQDAPAQEATHVWAAPQAQQAPPQWVPQAGGAQWAQPGGPSLADAPWLQPSAPRANNTGSTASVPTPAVIAAVIVAALAVLAVLITGTLFVMKDSSSAEAASATVQTASDSSPIPGDSKPAEDKPADDKVVAATTTTSTTSTTVAPKLPTINELFIPSSALGSGWVVEDQRTAYNQEDFTQFTDDCFPGDTRMSAAKGSSASWSCDDSGSSESSIGYAVETVAPENIEHHAGKYTDSAFRNCLVKQIQDSFGAGGGEEVKATDVKRTLPVDYMDVRMTIDLTELYGGGSMTVEVIALSKGSARVFVIYYGTSETGTLPASDRTTLDAVVKQGAQLLNDKA